MVVAGVVLQDFVAQAGAVDVDVDLGRGDALVAQHLLDGTQVGTALEQVRSARVALAVGMQVRDAELGEQLTSLQLVGMSQAFLFDGPVGRERRCLLQIADAQSVATDDASFVVGIPTGKYAQQRRFSCSVFGNEADVLPFTDGEREFVEQDAMPDALRQSHHFEVWSIVCHDSLLFLPYKNFCKITQNQPKSQVKVCKNESFIVFLQVKRLGY